MERIVFMGTPDFAVPALEALIASGNVVGVVTQPDRPAGRGKQLRKPPIKVAAELAGLPVFQPKSLRKPERAELLRAWEPDLIVVAAFGQILRPHVLELPRLGCVNVHASLLPRWRGAAPIQAAILAGDAESGVTLMQMDEGLDTGAMLVAESVPLDADETAATLHDKLSALGGELLRRHLDDLLNGRLTPIPQDNSLATYAPMIKKEDGALDWTEPAQVLERRVRAMTPWPGAYTEWQGKILKIMEAQPVTLPAQTPAQPGQVVQIDNSVIVGTGEDGLQLTLVQLAGKRPTAAADFINGRPDFIGAQLGPNPA